MKILLPDKVLEVMTRFKENGALIYVVGGSVRDLILNREVKDWDFTTNLTPDEMKKLFPKNSFCENNFGTFSVVLKSGEIFEITTFRTEKNYSDSRHPDKVEWGKSLEEDVMRRDFTINAMAADTEGEVVDYYSGIDDLQKGIIKTVGEADLRFQEDGLRMIRAVRLASQLGFIIEENTFESIIRNAKLINKISGERIRDEIFKILLTNKPADGIKLLKNSGLLAEIMPETLKGVDMVQRGHHIFDVWNHNLEALNNCESLDPITRLASFLHDVGKPVVAKENGSENTFYNHEVVGSRIAVAIGKRLKLSNKELDQLFKLVRWHMFTTEDIQTDKAVRRFIRNVTPEYLNEMIALRRADRVGSGAKETSWRWEKFKERLVEVQKQPFAIKDLKINGVDVMTVLGIKPGRKVGEVLEKIFAQVEENPAMNERETLLKTLELFKPEN